MFLLIVLLIACGILYGDSLTDAVGGEGRVPVGKYLIVDDSIEMVYQLPSPLDSIKGVLFVAHGCSHAATDWWPQSTSCPKCTGLPVEMSIVREAVFNRKFAVIAISSGNRIHKCWSAKDIPKVQRAIQYFYGGVLEGRTLPLYALGASSGGSFVGFLAQQTKMSPSVASICVQISSVGGDRLSDLPPTMFVLMSRDAHTLSHVTAVSDVIRTKSIVKTSPKIITPDYFSQHSNNFITLSESRILQSSLVKEKFIDADSLLLLEDPRETPWREVFILLNNFLSQLVFVNNYSIKIGCPEGIAGPSQH